VKKKSRPKSTPKAKPERKPKGGGKPKGPPKAKGKRASAAASKPKAPPPHKDPTVEGKPGDPDKMYGGFVLQLFDHDWRADAPAVYGGELRKVIFDKPIKTPAAAGTGGAAGSSNVQDQDTRMVAKLRRHLWTLGFWVFPRINKDGVIEPEASDTFDWRVEWAVREFQVAASMPNVAVQDIKKKPTEKEIQMPGKYLSTLSAKKNDKVFDEHPSGAVTTNTAEAIKYWLDKNYRCPLVIQAIRMKDVPGSEAEAKKGKKGKKGKGKKSKKIPDAVHTENIWRHDEVVASGVQMYAWDFSGHYEFPNGYSKECVYVGNYQPKPPFGGPISHAGWAEAKLTPESWQGQSWSEMDETHRSTWRAIMAVAAQECGGGLDIVNFWDNCLGSAGHFHWTMPKSDGSGGEFCGFMALLEDKYPDAFKKCFAKFGLWGPHWGGHAQDGRPAPNPGPTLSAYVYTRNQDATFERHPEAKKFAEAVWMRSWQSAYRLEMAARTCKEYRETMWYYAEHRLQSILKFGEVDAWLSTGTKAGKPKITLADVFTSERGVALLLRLHVWRPAFLMVGEKKKKVEPILHDALQALIDDGTIKDDKGKELHPSLWKAEHEAALVGAMAKLIGERCKPSAMASMQRARYWPLRVETKSPFGLVTAKKDGKNVPCLQGLSWIPRNADVDSVGPSERRGSFKLAE
jgi:hypothetical protein